PVILSGSPMSVWRTNRVSRRRVVEPYRTQRASSRISGLACITAVLLGIAVIPQPNLADAADGKGGDATALSVMRGAGSDRSDLSEVPAGGSVVLRGTRPS